MHRFALALVVALSCAGCSGGDAPRNTVEMTGGQLFDPETLTVPPGTTVTFVNESSESHTVTAYDGELPDGAAYFSSGGFGSEEAARDGLADALVAEGGSYEVTFDDPGTYEYFCIPHEDQGMIGTIVVEEG